MEAPNLSRQTSRSEVSSTTRDQRDDDMTTGRSREDNVISEASSFQWNADDRRVRRLASKAISAKPPQPLQPLRPPPPPSPPPPVHDYYTIYVCEAPENDYGTFRVHSLMLVSSLQDKIYDRWKIPPHDQALTYYCNHIDQRCDPDRTMWESGFF